jgi:hypothetical protein
MRYKQGREIMINGEKVKLTYFVSVRNCNVIENLTDMPNIEELRKCLTMNHKDEVWLTMDQK